MKTQNQALIAYLLDSGKPICGGPLELDPDTASFHLKKYPEPNEALTSPVILFGSESETEPTRIELNPHVWTSGKSGFRAFKKTPFGTVRINVVRFKENETEYGLDVAVENAIEAEPELPAAWAGAI